MPTERHYIDLEMQELREIARCAAACAYKVLPVFERKRPADARPRQAIEAALAFAKSGKRTAALRSIAMAAHRAAREAGMAAAAEASRSAGHAAASAHLHPLAAATQVKHILGAAAYAARERSPTPAMIAVSVPDSLDRALQSTRSSVAAVLARYPDAPTGGGRVAELPEPPTSRAEGQFGATGEPEGAARQAASKGEIVDGL